MNLQSLASHNRLYEKLYRDLGSEINAFLQDQDVNEILLNPDGKLWIDRAVKGLLCVGELNQTQAFSIIYGIAGIHGFVISSQCPHLEGELPCYETMHGERFSAQVPPIVSSPCFSIRKRSRVIYCLEDYINAGRLTNNQARILQDLLKNRKNLLVCGGPGSGKTTFTNALISEALSYDQNQRIIIAEDLPELQCHASNKINYVTTQTVSLRDLVRTSLRMRPDRIFVGEVRGSETLDMLKAFNTGAPGGICTIHANGAVEAIQRILDLSLEAGQIMSPISLILHTIHAIVFVVRQQQQNGFIQDILALGGYENGKFMFEKLDT